LNVTEKLTSNEVTTRILHVFVALFQFKSEISVDEAKIKRLLAYGTLRKYSMYVNLVTKNTKEGRKEEKEREKQCVNGRVTYISNTL
jgi:small nuclear ribonucleoprotein (snRNP)-like protein